MGCGLLGPDKWVVRNAEQEMNRNGRVLQGAVRWQAAEADKMTVKADPT